MRFYEVQDFSSHLQSLLTGNEQTLHDMRRSAFLLQAIGDLGTRADQDWAANYFDRILLRKTGFVEAADLLLETLLALSPRGDSTAFVERLRAEIATAPPGSQASNKLRELADNQLPGFAHLSEGKNRLQQTPSDRRNSELIEIYLAESDLSQPYLVTWAGRLIRRSAIEDDPAQIYAGFGEAIDAATAIQGRDIEVRFRVVRAGQAILYLQGQLTPAWQKLYDAAQPRNVRNFLWDDIEQFRATVQ
jgi:hypothetical protein